MVGVQCLAQGHFNGGNFNVPARGFELATFQYQDRSPNRSANAAPNLVQMLHSRRGVFTILTSSLYEGAKESPTRDVERYEIDSLSRL